MKNKLENVFEQIKELTVLELSDLINKLIKEFSISLISEEVVPTSAVKEEKTTSKLVSLSIEEVPFEKKISVLKCIRAITGFGLKESKDLIENLPYIIKKDVDISTIHDISKELETAGAKIKIL